MLLMPHSVIYFVFSCLPLGLEVEKVCVTDYRVTKFLSDLLYMELCVTVDQRSEVRSMVIQILVVSEL